jgi:predicted nucleic acid-binding protein
MIVADASALFQVLDRDSDAVGLEARLFGGAEPLCAPYLIDAEIANVLRKHALAGRIDEVRAWTALHDFLDMRLIRFSHTPLLLRVFALRDTMTAYDALYVALAESLSVPLVTCDRRLARAAAGLIAVEVF